MRYREVELNVVQGIGRQLWKWSVSFDSNHSATGQAATKREAVAEAERMESLATGFSAKVEERENHGSTSGVIGANHRAATSGAESRGTASPGSSTGKT